MANDLAVPQMAEAQAAPEVTSNNATAALGDALANGLDINLAAGNVTVTSLQYQRNIFFRAIGVATSGRTITLPQLIRNVIVIESDSANSNSIQLIRGATSLTLNPGRVYLVRTDGTGNGLVARDVGGVSEPSDHSVWVPGLLTNSQVLYRRKVLRAFTLPANLAGSFGSAIVASTGVPVISIKKNGTAVATATFTTSATATLATSGGLAQSFAVGDVLLIDGPASADSALAGVTLDLLGSR